MEPTFAEDLLDQTERRAREAIDAECAAAFAAAHPFTEAIVKEHATAESLWLVIRGKVCDVTKWQAGHPGGAKSLLNSGGKDATQTFEIVHSPKTVESFTKYVVGAVYAPDPAVFDGCFERDEPEPQVEEEEPQEAETA